MHPLFCPTAFHIRGLLKILITTFTLACFEWVIKPEYRVIMVKIDVELLIIWILSVNNYDVLFSKTVILTRVIHIRYKLVVPQSSQKIFSQFIDEYEFNITVILTDIVPAQLRIVNVWIYYIVVFVFWNFVTFELQYKIMFSF